MAIPATGSSIPVRTSRAVLVGVLVLVLALMAWDHLFGNEPGPREPFPVDPMTFAISIATVAVLAVVVFGFVVPRAMKRPERMIVYAVVLTVIAVVTAPLASWLGIAQVIAGGGIVLGLAARGGGRPRAGTTVVVLNVLVLAFGVLATALPSDAAAG